MAGSDGAADGRTGGASEPRPATRAAWLQLGVVALLTVAGYAALWPVQRSLFLAGLDPADPLALPRVPVDPEPARTAFLLVVLIGVALTLLSLWLVLLCRRWASPWLSRAALALPAAIAVALWLAPPSLSIDTYSYLAHGYLAVHGGNPYATPAAEVARTPFGPALGRAGWQAVHPQTPYGPLWTLVERLVVLAAGGNVTAGILLIKLPALLAVLGTAALLLVLLRRRRPALAVPGTLLYLTNPLVLVELAGDGHNDAVTLLLLVLAVLACVRRAPAVAIVALGVAVLTKATPAVFALPMAVHLIAQRRSWLRLAVESALGVVVVAAIAVASYAPYWIGSDTFAGIGATATPGPSWSVAGVVDGLLADPTAPPGTGTSPVLLALVAVLLVGAVVACVFARTVPGLLAGCAALSLLALLLLPVYWPWYSTLPLPFLALLASRRSTAAATLLALGSRLVAPMADLAVAGVIGWDAVLQHEQVLIGQTLPAAIGLLVTATHLIRWRAVRARSKWGPATPAPPETSRLQ